MRKGAVAFQVIAASLAIACPAHAGETRCWIDRGALVAPAAFGDIAGDFLIDLSAPTSQLHLTRANSAGIVAPNPTGDLVLAGERTSGFVMIVSDLDARTRAFDTVINGVIGADLLSRYRVEIDFSPCRLRLSHLPLGRARDASRLPIRIVGGRPAIEALVSDGVRVRSGLFAIDTAEWASHAHGRLSRSLVVQPDQEEPLVRLRAVEVAGRLFEQVPAALAGDDEDGSRGAIGLSIWSHWRLRLDMAAGWLDLIPVK